jgi:hypothetical protein
MTDATPASTSRRRVVAVVAGSTLALTLAFVGALAFLDGATTGLLSRLPWYLVATGALFVAAILLLESRTDDGRRILFSAAVASALGFAVVTFGVEGLVYAVRNPGAVLVSQLILYFVAAGLLATGLGYWTLNHWREFVAE